MTEGVNHRRISYRLLLTALWATLLVLAVEAIAGWVSGSLTLMAEALHTLVDAFSTLLSLIAVSSPHRPLGREIWGHGRAEVAATLMVTAFLGYTGASLTVISLSQVVGALLGVDNPFTVNLEPQILQFTAIMVITIIALGIYLGYQARTLNSMALRLNTQHFLADAWLSITMLIILLCIWQRQYWLDPVFALVLLALVIRSLWRVLNAQLPMLLRPTAIAPEAIAHTATQVEGVTRCIRIRSRGMVGRQVWVELHLAIHPEYMTMAEMIGERIEANLRERYGPLRAQIWVEESRPQLETGLPPINPYDASGDTQEDWR